jgi:hypothetical protein
VRNLTSLVLHDPAAAGTLVASIIPLALIFGVQPLPPEPTAAIVVAVNALVAFGLHRRWSAAESLAS